MMVLSAWVWVVIAAWHVIGLRSHMRRASQQAYVGKAHERSSSEHEISTLLTSTSQRRIRKLKPDYWSPHDNSRGSSGSE